MSHKQPIYNFWSSVQVFFVRTWNYKYTSAKISLGYTLWLSTNNCIISFGSLAIFLFFGLGSWTTKILNADHRKIIMYLLCFHQLTWSPSIPMMEYVPLHMVYSFGLRRMGYQPGWWFVNSWIVASISAVKWTQESHQPK